MSKPAKKRTKPPHIPTDEARAIVAAAVDGNRTQQQIAAFLDISVNTLKLYYAKELANGLTSLIVKSVLVVKSSLNNTAPEWAAQRLQTALTVLSRRAGWSETTEIKGKLLHEHAERVETARARLGELVKTGDHVTAGQVYEELLGTPEGTTKQ